MQEIPKSQKAEMTRIINIYGDSILRMCYLYLKDYHLAEDITQETFMKVFKHYKEFRKESSEKTWIVRIAINLCKNQMRMKWFTRKGMESIPEGTMEAGYESLIDREIVIRAISDLLVKYKEVVLLFYYQELSIVQIAQILHKTENNVKVLLSRAREKLKGTLQQDFVFQG